MRIIPKTDIIANDRILFTKGESYPIKEVVTFDNEKNLVTYDNQKNKNYIRMGGKFIENFLIG